MEKVQSNVFMSCVIGGMYQEFKLEEEAFEKLSICLKNVQGKNMRNRTDNDSSSLKQVKLLRSLIREEYLSLASFYNEVDEEENNYLKEVLSILSMKRFFQIQMSQVSEWFYYLGKYAKRGSLQDYKLQEKMFYEGLKNTEYLSKLGLQVIDDQFVCTEEKQMPAMDKPVLFVKKAKRIS